MARIRTIKPEFFTSEDIVSMTPLARLFYVSLWCEADREGRFPWRPKTLKMRYLPGDDCDIEALAEELVSSGLVALYEANGKILAEIPSFKNHQVINNRESDSTLPSRVGHASVRVKAEGRKEGKEGNGKEGKGKEDAALPVDPPIESIPAKAKQQGVVKPDDVTDQTWSDWLHLRKSKKAPVTETVLTGAKSEAEKADLSLEDFLQIWCTRGSQGLQAEWIKPSERSRYGKSTHSGLTKTDYTKGINDDGSFS